MAALIHKRLLSVGLLTLLLSSCFQPPYNNFQRDPRPTARVIAGAGIGAGFGAIAGSVAGNTLAGAAVGGVLGTLAGLYSNNQRLLMKHLYDEEIQFYEYGDTMTLVVPTDHYYIFNTARLNERCYKGLLDIVKLLQYFPCSPIYVAAFTDNVGTSRHKRLLSQAQAETMLTFLWANHIPAQRLKAEGYGDKHDVGNNDLIRGSAYNRRVEIQWVNTPSAANCSATPYVAAMK